MNAQYYRSVKSCDRNQAQLQLSSSLRTSKKRQRMSGAEAELSVGGARRQIADWVSVWRRPALTPVTKLEIIIGGLPSSARPPWACVSESYDWLVDELAPSCLAALEISPASRTYFSLATCLSSRRFVHFQSVRVTAAQCYNVSPVHCAPKKQSQRIVSIIFVRTYEIL